MVRKRRVASEHEKLILALDKCWNDDNIDNGIVLLEMLRVLSNWGWTVEVRKL